MYNIKKVIFIIIGIISFTLGSIGVLLPILPTTPFILLASFCFVRGSKRFDMWLKSSNIYKNHLEDFVENRAMTLKQKICILVFADIMIAFPLIILDSIYAKACIVVLVIFKYYYFIFKVETIKSKDIL